MKFTLGISTHSYFQIIIIKIIIKKKKALTFSTQQPPTTAQRGYSTREKFGKKQFKTAFSGPPGHFRLSLFPVPATFYSRAHKE